MPLSSQGSQNAKSILDSATSDGKTGVPGLVFVAVDKAGQTLVEHASGTKSINSAEPVDFDTTFWFASMTKLVTVIAILQLVEREILGLDDPEIVKKYAPEIGKKRVYVDGVNGADQQTDITLRMLLAHTAGFAYSFLDPRVSMQSRPMGITELHGDVQDIFESPMVNQPGSMWEYGISIDWAGIILERATGERLNDYFGKHIFEPLGMTDMTMFPSKEVQRNMAYLHQRDPTIGALTERDHIYRRVMRAETKEEQGKFFHSGGGGLFGKPKEYTKILATLLNNGTSPVTKAKILSPDTVNLMWENQIPNQPDFARHSVPPAQPELFTPAPEMYPQEGNPPQGWSFAGFLTTVPGATGRGANTVWWAGLANCFWWVDREKGVAGVMAGQILPYGDAKVVETWARCESAVYAGLEQ